MPRRIAKSTQDKALSALEGMTRIVDAEMIVRGSYVEQKIHNRAKAEAGAICKGHRYCAIGSLWVGGGVLATNQYGGWDLPGVGEGWERQKFLANRPGLKIAYDALNEAATEYAVVHNHDLYTIGFDAPIEALFEGVKSVGRFELLEVINAAAEKIRARPTL